MTVACPTCCDLSRNVPNPASMTRWTSGASLNAGDSLMACRLMAGSALVLGTAESDGIAGATSTGDADATGVVVGVAAGFQFAGGREKVKVAILDGSVIGLPD